jgi:hypothetical protein
MNIANLNRLMERRLKKLLTINNQKINSKGIDPIDDVNRKNSCVIRKTNFLDENNLLFKKDDRNNSMKIKRKNTNENKSIDFDGKNTKNNFVKTISISSNESSIKNSNYININNYENDRINIISNLNIDDNNNKNNIKSENQRNNKNNNNNNNSGINFNINNFFGTGIGKSYLKKKNEIDKLQNQNMNKYVPFNNRNKENILKSSVKKSSEHMQNKIINEAEKKLNEINSYTYRTKFAQQNSMIYQPQQNESIVNEQIKNKTNTNTNKKNNNNIKTPKKNTNIKCGKFGYEIMFNKNNYFNNYQNLKSINQKKQLREIRRQSKSFNENDFRYLELEENQNNNSYIPDQISLSKDKDKKINNTNNNNQKEEIYSNSQKKIENSNKDINTKKLKNLFYEIKNNNNNINNNNNNCNKDNNNNNNNYLNNLNDNKKSQISNLNNSENKESINININNNSYSNTKNLNLNININSNLELTKTSDIKKFSENFIEKEKKIYYNEDSKNIMDKIYYINNKKNEFNNDENNYNYKDYNENKNNNNNENFNIGNSSIFQNLIEFSEDNLNPTHLKEIQKILFGKVDNVKNNFHFKSVMKLLKKNIDIIIKCRDFDIFNFENFVGEENSLPILSIILFEHMNFFKFLNKKYFENFIYEISRGYIKENYYHNDRHAGDVLHSSFTYLTIGRVKEVNK